MAPEGGIVQRSSAVRIAGVDIGAMLDEQARDLEIALKGRGIERRRTGFAARFRITATREQDLDNIFLPFEDRVFHDVPARGSAFR